MGIRRRLGFSPSSSIPIGTTEIVVKTHVRLGDRVRSAWTVTKLLGIGAALWCGYSLYQSLPSLTAIAEGAADAAGTAASVAIDTTTAVAAATASGVASVAAAAAPVVSSAAETVKAEAVEQVEGAKKGFWQGVEGNKQFVGWIAKTASSALYVPNYSDWDETPMTFDVPKDFDGKSVWASLFKGDMVERYVFPVAVSQEYPVLGSREAQLSAHGRGIVIPASGGLFDFVPYIRNGNPVWVLIPHGFEDTVPGEFLRVHSSLPG